MAVTELSFNEAFMEFSNILKDQIEFIKELEFYAIIAGNSELAELCRTQLNKTTKRVDKQISAFEAMSSK